MERLAPPSKPLSNSKSSTTKITDLDDDALFHCLRGLNPQDISSVAMACKSLRRIAYSDSIWGRFIRETWPHRYETRSRSFPWLGMREAYFARQVEMHKLKFVKPLGKCYGLNKPLDHLLILDEHNMVYSQGPKVRIVHNYSLLCSSDYVDLNDHNETITCMRSFPLAGTSLFQSDSSRTGKMLLTSSSDQTVRLWWKGSCQQCFRGHEGSVTALSDRLLGDESGKVFASGGEDGSLRIWSLCFGSESEQSASKATLYGHKKPIKFMSVAGHKTSLLASVATDSMVRVWDVAASSSSSSSGGSPCCVGTASVTGRPVAMKCHESLVYVASGSAVVAVDLRTMRKVLRLASSNLKVNSFAVLHSAPLVCAGGDGRALLWDIRRTSTGKPRAVAKMRHKGKVTQLHMDQYKIVTGGLDDVTINVWDTGTGKKMNSFWGCCDRETRPGCSAMAVKGCQIATASFGGDLYLRDFSRATVPVPNSENEAEHAPELWLAFKRD